MAPKKKKRKLSKAERHQLQVEKGKKGAEARGVGLGSRKSFALAANWREEPYKSGERTRLRFVSPGKTKYPTQTGVKAELIKRNLTYCLHDQSTSSEDQKTEDDSSDEEKVKWAKHAKENGGRKVSSGVEIERRLFVCESTQVMDMVEQFNATSKCSTENCNGFLVAVKVEPTGLGGSMNVVFACNGCELRTINFCGSALVEGSKRTVVGFALAVAFFITGHGYAKFSKTLRQCLGISCISKNPYYETIKLVYPKVTEILNGMCDEEKERMKEVDDGQLGSWQRAVVTSDGVWHTRGHFSKNGSFIIKNYLTGGLVWYGHKCMKGKDDVVEDELFEGTSKSMEGILAEECYKQAKEEGCKVEVVWQDGDSSAAKAVSANHPDGKIYKCGGHVGRAHYNQLKEAAKKKQFSAEIKNRYKGKFPQVQSAVCKCERHKSGCGCLGDNFLKNARINHFCCLQQCDSPQEYARRMRAVGEYHCRDIHEWGDGEECGFHENTECSCKKCDEDEVIKCQGKPYKTKTPLTCEYHWLAYRIECERRAEDANSVIHPTMGRGHSNLCEAHFSVLPDFRAKDQNLCRLHYITSTNCGFCQGNMSWCYKVRGPNYHWVIDLYERLNLPVIPAVIEALQKEVVDRMKEIETGKTDHKKKIRIQMKVARAEDQEARKKWVKRQAVQHTYGNDADDGNTDEHDVDPNITAAVRDAIGGAEETDGTLVIISGKSCRCGSKTHKRVTHSDCPLNPRNAK